MLGVGRHPAFGKFFALPTYRTVGTFGIDHAIDARLLRHGLQLGAQNLGPGLSYPARPNFSNVPDCFSILDMPTVIPGITVDKCVDKARKHFVNPR